MLASLLQILILVQSTFGFYLLVEEESSSEPLPDRLITAKDDDYKILVAGGSFSSIYRGFPINFGLEDGILSGNGTQVGQYSRDDSYFDVVFQLNDEPVDKFSIEKGYLNFDGSDKFKGCNGFLINKYVDYLSVSENCTISSDLKLKVLEC